MSCVCPPLSPAAELDCKDPGLLLPPAPLLYPVRVLGFAANIWAGGWCRWRRRASREGLTVRVDLVTFFPIWEVFHPMPALERHTVDPVRDVSSGVA